MLLKATNVRRKMQGHLPLILGSALIGPAGNDVSTEKQLRVRFFPHQDIVRFDCPRVKESQESNARVKREASLARKNRRQCPKSNGQLDHQNLCC